MTEIKSQLSSIFIGIDSVTPLNETLRGKYLRSFAYYTIKERLPVILTNIVDQLVRNKAELTECKDIAEDDMKICIRNISKLKNEVQTNKNFIELVTKVDDAKMWNDYLAEQRNTSDGPNWFNSPWLYSECYMYRRLQEIFEISRVFNKYDHFGYQKKEALDNCLSDLKLLSTYFDNVVNAKEKARECYTVLLKLALWGNQSDLSISSAKNIIANEMNIDYIKMLDESILVDDNRKLLKILMDSQTTSNFIIDYILDNAGLELFCDLCFCDFLVTAEFATSINFHAKKFPWYVSDATRNDVKCLINKMIDIGLEELASRWGKYFANSTWTIYEENYWTTPFTYNEMSSRDPALYQKLCQSSLVIFKGDLNYRRLVQDINWKHTEKFEVAIGKFHPGNILALRIVKSDIICGLTYDKIKGLPSDQMWMRTGEFGMVQLHSVSE